MSIEERRERERAARRQLIVATARAVAEAEGWDAVTTRRLSTEIEYSQPVLYKHFSSMEQVADAVALDGYAELAEAIRAVGATDGTAVGGRDGAGQAPYHDPIERLSFERRLFDSTNQTSAAGR